MGSKSVGENDPLSIPPGGGITLALVPTRGGKIVAYWTDADGCKQARLCANEQEVRELKGRLDGTNPWTLRWWTEEWLCRVAVLLRQEKLKHSTFAAYLRVVRNHIRGSALWSLPLESIHRKEIRAWAREKMTQGSSLNSLRQHVAVMRLIFAEAREDDIVEANPVSGLIRGLRLGERNVTVTRKALGIEELKALIGAIDGVLERRTALLLVCTGIRLGEAHGLWWEDVDFEAGQIRIERQLMQEGVYGTPKTLRSRRTVDAPAYLLDEMKSWERLDHTVLGVQPADGNKCRIRLRTAIDRAAATAKLSAKVTPHALRHTYAVAHKHLGRDWKWLQEQLGHSSMVTTSETYAGAIPLTDRQAADELGEILREGTKTP